MRPEKRERVTNARREELRLCLSRDRPGSQTITAPGPIMARRPATRE